MANASRLLVHPTSRSPCRLGILALLVAFLCLAVSSFSLASPAEICHRLKSNQEEVLLIGPYMYNHKLLLLIYTKSGKALLFTVKPTNGKQIDYLQLNEKATLDKEKHLETAVGNFSSRRDTRYFLFSHYITTYLGKVQQNYQSRKLAKLNLTFIDSMSSSLPSNLPLVLSEIPEDSTLYLNGHLFLSGEGSALVMNAACQNGTITCRAGSITVDDPGEGGKVTGTLTWEEDKCLKLCTKNSQKFHGLMDMTHPRAGVYLRQYPMALYFFSGGTVWHSSFANDYGSSIRVSSVKELFVCKSSIYSWWPYALLLVVLLLGAGGTAFWLRQRQRLGEDVDKKTPDEKENAVQSSTEDEEEIETKLTPSTLQESPEEEVVKVGKKRQMKEQPKEKKKKGVKRKVVKALKKVTIPILRQKQDDKCASPMMTTPSQADLQPMTSMVKRIILADSQPGFKLHSNLYNSRALLSKDPPRGRNRKTPSTTTLAQSKAPLYSASTPLQATNSLAPAKTLSRQISAQRQPSTATVAVLPSRASFSIAASTTSGFQSTAPTADQGTVSGIVSGASKFQATSTAVSTARASMMAPVSTNRSRASSYAASNVHVRHQTSNSNLNTAGAPSLTFPSAVPEHEQKT